MLQKDEDPTVEYYKNKHVFIENGTLYVLGEFNQDISNNVIPKMQEIMNGLSQTVDPQFEIVINSPGGYTNELLSILYYLDEMKKQGIKIITKNIGEACSCGAMLACYGDERYMGARSTFLLHYGNYPVSPFTNMEDIERLSNSARDDFEMTLDLYSKHSSLKKDKLRKLLQSDHLRLDAKTCLEYGFVDYIV